MQWSEAGRASDVNVIGTQNSIYSLEVFQWYLFVSPKVRSCCMICMGKETSINLSNKIPFELIGRILKKHTIIELEGTWSVSPTPVWMKKMLFLYYCSQLLIQLLASLERRRFHNFHGQLAPLSYCSGNKGSFRCLWQEAWLCDPASDPITPYCQYKWLSGSPCTSKWKAPEAARPLADGTHSYGRSMLQLSDSPS